jgi:NADH-quinone oxidoreductase subunit J
MLTLSFLQIIFGFLVIVTALMVIWAKNPVVSAMMLMATLFLTGGLYLGLGLYFIGAVQILIYAGAIAVLFIFIVMLLDLKPFRLQIPGRNLIGGMAFLASLLFLIGFMVIVVPEASSIGGVGENASDSVLKSANAVSISLFFISKYMIPFQMAGLLITGAVLGAVALGRPRKPNNSVEGSV